jgi:outer membrane protein assembly factor BamB
VRLCRRKRGEPGRHRLQCLQAADGRPVWAATLWRDTTQRLQEWYGFCSSPVLEGGTLYLNHGTHGLLVDARTGQSGRPTDGRVNGYAVPRFWQAGGSRFLILFGWDVVKSVDLARDTLAWSVPWKTRFDVNAADPVVCPEGVFVTSGHNKGRVVCCSFGR